MTQMGDLVPLYDQPGPFVSVYLDTTSGIGHAQSRLDLRWKSLRRDLARAGAEEPTLAAVDDEVDGRHISGGTRVVIAAGGAALHVANYPGPPGRDTASWSMLPRLAPLVAARQATKSHVVVLANRTGADILALPDTRAGFSLTVDGLTELVTRSAPEGPWQTRIQRAIESPWEGNSALVAATLVGVVDDVRPELVVAAGDARAVQFLRAALPRRVLDRLRVVDGSRNSAGDGAVDARVADLVHAAASAETTAVLARFQAARGRYSGADGARASFGALTGGQVATLLLHDHPDDRRRAWFGPEPDQLATARRSLRAAGVAAPCKGRLIEVALRAALGTGATVRMYPATNPNGPRGGVGAILRNR